MKRSIARRWASALDSGEYKQTVGRLRDDEGFCCIGVLCNIHAQDNPEIAAKETDMYSYLGCEEEAPEEVLEWSGMKEPEGELPERIRGHMCLTGLNDNAQMSFPEIAKIIRKHWKEL